MNLKLKFRIIELFGYQADFAQRAGVQESLVSRVVRGRRSISKEDQKKWARILEQDVKHLFGHEKKDIEKEIQNENQLAPN